MMFRLVLVSLSLFSAVSMKADSSIGKTLISKARKAKENENQKGKGSLPRNHHANSGYLGAALKAKIVHTFTERKLVAQDSKIRPTEEPQPQLRQQPQLLKTRWMIQTRKTNRHDKWWLRWQP